MTRRGLFKMLAATPLAGIVATEPWYMRNACMGYGISFSNMWETHEEWLKQPVPKHRPFEFYFDGPEVPKIGDTITLKTPRLSEWKKAASILDDIDKRFSSAPKYFKANRANIQS